MIFVQIKSFMLLEYDGEILSEQQHEDVNDQEGDDGHRSTTDDRGTCS